MGKLYKQLNIRKETFNLVMDDCVEEFLRYNPKFEGMNITQEFIVQRIAKSYLEKL